MGDKGSEREQGEEEEGGEWICEKEKTGRLIKSLNVQWGQKMLNDFSFEIEIASLLYACHSNAHANIR